MGGVGEVGWGYDILWLVAGGTTILLGHWVGGYKKIKSYLER